MFLHEDHKAINKYIKTINLKFEYKISAKLVKNVVDAFSLLYKLK